MCFILCVIWFADMAPEEYKEIVSFNAGMEPL